MRTANKFFSLFIAILLVFGSGITALAMPGAGLVQAPIVAYGCDVSWWNVSVDDDNYDIGYLDFEKMKADGCDFVIIRIGYEGSSTGYNVIDDPFLDLYYAAREAGMDIGIYFYALATTYDEAAEDAQWVMNVINTYGLYFEYPLYYDVETVAQSGLYSDDLDSLCRGWCETLENAGFFPGVYSYDNLIDRLPATFKAEYDVWRAEVLGNTDNSEQYVPEEYDFSNICSMWQYAWYEYEYDGVGKEMLDVNVAYKDYPAIMLQYGYNNMQSALPDAISNARTTVYTDYTEEDLATLHRLYDEAVAMTNDSNATLEEQNELAEKLNSAIADKAASNETAASGYVYVDGFNSYIDAGESQIFTSDFGTINGTTANTVWTVNMVAKWDSSTNNFVVKSVWSSGGVDTETTLADDEFFIAVHSWEDTVPGSEQNAANLLNASVGQVVELHGIDVENKTFGAAPYISIYTSGDFADYTEYNKAVNNANQLDASAYTASSWADLESALAVDVRGLASDDQATVDAATKAINDALGALVEKESIVITSIELGTDSKKPNVGTDVFEPTVISINGDASLADDYTDSCFHIWYTIDSVGGSNWVEYDGATFIEGSLYDLYFVFYPTALATISDQCVFSLTTANGISEGVVYSHADDRVAFDFYFDLTTAVEDADYTEYNKAVNDANAVDTSIYTEDSVADLESALAVDVSGLTSDDQATVDAATKAINDAIGALIEKDADYTEYNKAVSDANALNADDYTADSWADLESALATDVSGLKISDQATVDAATKAINDAIGALVDAPVAVVIYGDIDGNGTFDGNDLVLARQVDATVIEIDQAILDAIEVSGDGIFDGADVVLMVQMDAGAISQWPVA